MDRFVAWYLSSPDSPATAPNLHGYTAADGRQVAKNTCDELLHYAGGGAASDNWRNSADAAELIVQAANFVCPKGRPVVRHFARSLDWVRHCANDLGDIACPFSPDPLNPGEGSFGLVPDGSPLRLKWARP
jgi:hypothetical protein